MPGPPGLLGYPRRTLPRFLLLALPLLVVLAALYNLTLELLGLQPDLGPLVGWRSGAAGLPGGWIVATWCLEALALTALFLLVDGRGGWRWLNGLLTGWIAWVFRGPLLVMTVVGFAGLARRPWWQLSFRWFVLYTAAGLLLGILAKASGLGRSGARGREATAERAPRAVEPREVAAPADPEPRAPAVAPRSGPPVGSPGPSRTPRDETVP